MNKLDRLIDGIRDHDIKQNSTYSSTLIDIAFPRTWLVGMMFGGHR